VTGGVLHVFEGNTGLAGAGDERHPQRVRPDFTGAVQCGPGRDPADYLPGLGLAHPLTRQLHLPLVTRTRAEGLLYG
jgi:hypothetical protein